MYRFTVLYGSVSEHLNQSHRYSNVKDKSLMKSHSDILEFDEFDITGACNYDHPKMMLKVILYAYNSVLSGLK